MSKLQMVPNVRYHRCDRCLNVFECDACTTAMHQSQERSRRRRRGIEAITLYAPEHQSQGGRAWVSERVLCDQCAHRKQVSA